MQKCHVDETLKSNRFLEWNVTMVCARVWSFDCWRRLVYRKRTQVAGGRVEA
ncbi:hypothetical protein HanIR_Chr12g0578291 [Helianthus annuus]|nr:hypothetical protein HanIR_Chr12g0578291 [Helianthus annuus]